MRTLLAAVLALSALGADAQQLGMQQQRVDLRSGETRRLTVLGATAAWAIDPSVVDVSAAAATVELTGRSAGRTKVIVAARGSESVMEVVVTGHDRQAASKAESAAGTVETRYVSAQQEVRNTVTVARDTGPRRSELVVDVAYANAPAGGQTATTLPAASYRIFTAERELTLLDRVVDYSPLTLSSTAVRGVHYVDQHWRLHAGVTSWSSNRSFLLPVDREQVAAGGYAFDLGRGRRFTPGVMARPGEGAVLSLLYDVQRDERLRGRAEIAFSDGVGAAAQFAWRGDHDRADVDVRYRPREFTVVGPGEVRGLLGDATWSHRWNDGSTLDARLSATDLANVGLRAVSASAEYDARLTESLTLTSGGSWGEIADAETVTLPAGLRFDLSRGSVALRYRWSRNSATERGSHGIRLSASSAIGRLHLSGYADRSQDSPTLALVLREQPELALALQELGLSVTSPEDVARLLRENASLIALGFIEGVTVDLAPLRTQIGLEAAWSGRGPARNQVRARLFRNVAESVSGAVETTIASLTWSRRLTRETDVYARYSAWRTHVRGSDPVDQPYWEAGIRHRFDSVPSLLPTGTGSIGGVVFLDEDLDGNSDGAGVGGVEVELDAVRSTRTDEDGGFEFSRVPKGTHRLVARVPGRPEAYFTTPSAVQSATGERVSFGIALTPARLLGRVTSDAGEGVGGVIVTLTRGSSRLSGATGSDGSFAFSAPPGEWVLALTSDSVPPGFSPAAAPRAVTLDRSAPARAELVVRAMRTVAISGLLPAQEVEVRPLNRRAVADENGRVALRSMPAGDFSLVAGGQSRSVSLGSGPETRKVEFALAAAAAGRPPAPRQARRAAVPLTGSGQYVVQLGAFRNAENAAALAERARRNGFTAGTLSHNELTIVRVGPYATRGEASEAATQLARGGIEGFVTSRP